MRKVEWKSQTGISRWSTSTFERSCGCTALDMPEWRETAEQTDWRAKQLPQVACFSEVLRSLRHYLRAQSQGHHTTDRLEGRGVDRRSGRRFPSKDERGNSSVKRTLEPFQRQRWGNFWETGWSACGLFPAHRYHLELNWTELKSSWALNRTAFFSKCCFTSTETVGTVRDSGERRTSTSTFTQLLSSEG